MKKLLLLLLIPNFIYAELVLEITQGSDNPYSLAVIDFNGPQKISKKINSIIKSEEIFYFLLI